MSEYKIAVIVGSLHKNSFNLQLANAVVRPASTFFNL